MKVYNLTMKVYFTFILTIMISSSTTDGLKLYTNEFVFQFEGNKIHSVLNSLSGSNLNLTLLKHIVSDFYLFEKTDYPKMNDEPIYSAFQREVKIALKDQVKFFRQEVMHKRGNYLPGKDIRGPRRIPRETITESYIYQLLGVDKVWNKGYYGSNVTVAVVDCGVDMNHEDLQPNIVPRLSYDYIDGKDDANPPNEYQDSDYLDHGTNCAGLIAGIKGNNVCGDDIAPRASIAAVRIFNEVGHTTDNMEAEALKHRLEDIDIYSSSWTTSDQVLYDGPGIVAQNALETAVNQGRKGKGSIYIFPSGNGGKEDNCNGDGYANSIYTATIGSAMINGDRPHYTENCPCALTTTLGEGGNDPFSYLVTCNRTSNGRCSTVFQGSSVATALASGIVALALNAKFKRGKKHKNIQFKHFSSDMCVNTSREITRLEHVQLKLDLWAHDPSNLEIFLKSPMTTVSRLMTKRSKKLHSSSSINWTYMSVHFWDENPSGKWTLKIKIPREKKEYQIRHKELIKINHVAVILYGTASNENDTGAQMKMTQDTPSNKNDTDMKDSPMQLDIRLIAIGLLLLPLVSIASVWVYLALRK